jgi:hypothetical protein
MPLDLPQARILHVAFIGNIPRPLHGIGGYLQRTARQGRLEPLLDHAPNRSSEFVARRPKVPPTSAARPSSASIGAGRFGLGQHPGYDGAALPILMG